MSTGTLEVVTRWLPIIALFVFCLGCGSQTPAESTTGARKQMGVKDSPAKEPVEPETKEGKLAEQLRSGAVQMEATLATIEEAQDALKKINPEIRKPVQDGIEQIEESIDGAGETLADAMQGIPTEEDAVKDFKAADESRQKRIKQMNDALQDLSSAANICSSLAEEHKAFADPAAILKSAVEDLGEAITSMGGTPTEE